QRSRSSRVARSLVTVSGAEDGWEVLGLGQESDDVDVVGGDEVEPAAGEAGDSAEAQPRDVAEVADTRRSGARHATDRIERGDGRVEEAPSEVVAALSAVVAGPLDEIGLRQGPEPCGRHASPSSARARKSAMTSSVSGRPSPEARQSAISSRSRFAACWS